MPPIRLGQVGKLPACPPRMGGNGLIPPRMRLDVRMWNMGDPDFDVHLERCNIFYMRGGNPHAFQNLFTSHGDSMRSLSARVLTGNILYIGG